MRREREGRQSHRGTPAPGLVMEWVKGGEGREGVWRALWFLAGLVPVTLVGKMQQGCGVDVVGASRVCNRAWPAHL